MNIRIIVIAEDILEKDFPDYIKKKGYACIKFTRQNLKEIKKHISPLISKEDWNLIFTNGKPDFFIWNIKRDFAFIEFKSKNDSISHKQIEWLLNNQLHAGLAIVMINKRERFKFKNTFYGWDYNNLKDKRILDNCVKANYDIKHAPKKTP